MKQNYLSGTAEQNRKFAPWKMNFGYNKYIVLLLFVVLVVVLRKHVCNSLCQRHSLPTRYAPAFLHFHALWAVSGICHWTVSRVTCAIYEPKHLRACVWFFSFPSPSLSLLPWAWRTCPQIVKPYVEVAQITESPNEGQRLDSCPMDTAVCVHKKLNFLALSHWRMF